MERQSSEPAPSPSLLASVGRARRMAMAMSALRGSASGAQGDGPSDLCICQRPHSVVLCHVCGWYSRCRLLKSCRQHPNTRFLLDMTTCPRCRAPSHMMGEYDLGDRELPPCPLPMPSPQAVKGPSPSSRRSSSPETPDRRPSPLTSPGCGAAMGSGGQRVRMRPPLQSDSQGMQRKMRDRYCLQMQPRTPSGLPVSLFLADQSSPSPYGNWGCARGGGAAVQRSKAGHWRTY